MLVARMGSGWVLVVCVALCIGLVSAQHNHAHKHEEEHTEDDGHAHEPHIRVKRKVNITGLREECRPDPRCRPCASFERTELFCLRTGFKQQLTCSVDGKVVRIGYEACDSDSNVSALRFLGVCSLVLAGSALLVHLRKKCIIREHLQKLEAMSNV